MDGLTFTAMALAALGLNYHFDLVGGVADWLTRTGVGATGRVFDQHGAAGHLAHEFPFREISPAIDLLETGFGFYTGLEIAPAPTDGVSDEGLDFVTRQIDRALHLLPADAHVQTLTCVDNDASEVSEMFDRLAAHSPSAAHAALLRARDLWWRRRAESQHVRTRRTWLLVGVRVKSAVVGRIGVKGWWSGRPWQEASVREVRAARLELMSLREDLKQGLRAAGVTAREMDFGVVWDEYWQQLNPLLGRDTPAPAYSCGEASPNPRKLLTQTDVTKYGWMLRFGDAAEHAYAAALVCNKLPSTTDALTMSDFLRAVPFPVLVSAHAHLLDSRLQRERLNARHKDLTVSVRVSNNAATRTESRQARDTDVLLEQLEDGDTRAARLGWSVVFGGATPAEMTQKRRTILRLLGQCRDMSAASDSNVPLEPFVETLPGCHYRDRKPWGDATSRQYVGLSGLTGGPAGAPLEESLHVFEQLDGGAWGYAPAGGRNDIDTQIVLGRTGSGKSAFLNLMTTVHRNAGYRQLTFDVGGSSTRVALMEGDDAQIVRLGDPACTGLGFMSILPHADEQWHASELTAGKVPLPIERLAQLVYHLSLLATDWHRGETGISRIATSVLQQGLLTVFENSGGRPQPLAALLDVFKSFRRIGNAEERAIAEDLRRKLMTYAEDGAYGRFLNDTSPPLAVTKAHTVLDFAGCNLTPELGMITAMAAGQFVPRFLRVNRHVPKAFTMDEGNEVLDDPVRRKISAHTATQARKFGVRAFLFATQSADHLRNFPDVLNNSSTQWLFHTSAPDAVNDVLRLPGAGLDLLRNLRPGDDTYRPVVVRRGDAYAALRLVHNSLDQLLCLGASATDVTTLEEARRAVPGGVLPEQLERALTSDALGRKS